MLLTSGRELSADELDRRLRRRQFLLAAAEVADLTT
jgi:hypothetical protein